MTVRFKSPREAAFDLNGNPRSGAKLYFYEPTTTTPKDVYSDSTLTTPISQPVVASSAGLWATIYMEAALYRVICKDANDVTIYDEDNYDPGLAAGFGVDSVVGIAQGGTGAANAAAARANLGAASSDALSSAQNDITELQTQVATGLNVDDEFGDLAAKDSVARTDLATSFGVVVVQAVDATPYTNYGDISAVIPADDTIPVSSEGLEITSANITPASSSNKIRIRFDGFGFVSGSSSSVTVALFRGTTCIYAKHLADNSVFASLDLFYIDSPASTSQQTYSVRVGPSTGHVYVNGNASNRLMGGKAACTMRLEELETH